MLFNSNNSIQHYSFVSTNDSVSNNSILHKSFIFSPFKYQTFIFDPSIGPYQMLPLRVRVDQEVIAMKEYSTFHKSPKPWCNGYRRRKWSWWHEFKSWTRLITFHIALIPLGKVWIQLFSLQLWVNNRTDCVLQPWWGN